MSSISTDLTYGLALDPKTAETLANFARRRRVLLILRAIAAGLVFFFATMTVVAICDYLWLLPDAIRWMLSFAAYTITVASIWWFGPREFRNEDPQRIARQLESADPRLREDLLSAVELANPNLANGSESFRGWLQRSVGTRVAKLNIGRLLPVGLVQRWLLTGTVILVACVVMFMMPKMQFGRRMARAMLPGIAIERASLTEITILKPSPASGFVAEGDAVGVVARVRGDSIDDVVMQWRTEDGGEGETLMTPRIDSPGSISDGTLQHHDVFAANLSIGTTAIQYRVTAGDAITLWHELTPLPRPRVESFRKQYKFPDYANLDDRVEEAEHGDLKALVGTLAEVTVRFDEPVDGASLQFGNRGVTFQLDAVDGSDRDFVVEIPIRTPATYQIDATSTRSGLNNPFSPQYSITPVIDSPPLVRWDPSVTQTTIVSPLDVVPLAMTATDDLPMERVVQEFQINGDPVVRREIPVSEAARELNLRWDWDLMRRIDGEEPSIKLAGGDIIRTRMVGIDRRGQRGESPFIELLVAEEGFDSDRHARLQELGDLLSQVADWSVAARQLMDQLHKTAAEASAEDLRASRNAAEELHEQKETITVRLQDVVESCESRPRAGALEMIGRSMLDVDQKLAEWFAVIAQVTGKDYAASKASREKELRELVEQARRISQDASRLDQYARAVFGETLTVGIVGDALALRRSLRPLVSDDSQLPPQRFPRHLAVSIGRMEVIGALIKQHQTTLPESTRRHLENWDRWAETWSERLRASIKQPPNPDAHRALVKQFEAELVNQFNHGMVDGRLASTVTNMLRGLRIQVAATADRERRMAAFGDAMNRASEQSERESDSDRVAELNRDAALARAKFDLARQHLLERLEQEESLHRSRPNVDLQYAADMNLMQRAIENVTSEGYLPYRDEPAVIVHQNLSYAFQTIEAKHEADMWLGELREMMLAERRLEETAAAKVRHPSWIERFPIAMEWPVRTLQNTAIQWKEIEPIDKARYSQAYNEARNLIVTRRWSNEQMVTAETQLEKLERALTESLEALEPHVAAARETIQKYVLTLPEQAREAAEKAREAQARTESRPDSQAETAEQLDQQQQQAEEAARDTLESLVNLANTADFTDPQQRELARDADAAAAEIQHAAELAEAAMDRANDAPNDQDRSESLDQAAQALEDLAESLETTAEHFERAEAGEDVAQSREQLRQAEEALRMEQELQERFDRAESLAEAAESTPEELMERLERELSQNEPMQEELTDIAERAAEAAQQTLERAAREETSLNQSLERSDPTFQERKRRAARQLETLARRAASVDQSLLNAADRAMSQAKTPEARPKLNEAREQLREAVQQANQMGGENALLSEMQQTAGEMSQALEAASEALAEAQQQAAQAQEEKIHKDDASRNRSKQEMENAARHARNQQLQAASSEKRQWAAAEREAGRRVQAAQRQKRDAENRKRQAEQRMAQDKNNAAHQAARDQSQKQIDDATRAEEAARETRDFADQQEKQSAQREQAVKKQKLPPLAKPNPAAELAARTTQKAGEELDAIRDDLGELADQAAFGDQLRTPPPQAEQIARQQQDIEEDVNQAAEQLRRAARHEQRLGQQQLAEQLNAAAEAVAENAAEAAAQAAESLQQAAGNPEQSPQANQAVSDAADQIRQAAQQVAEMLEQIAPPSDAQSMTAQAGEATETQQRGQQLARTLDELDRAMAQSQQSSEQSSQQSSESPADDAQAGQPQNGEPQGGQPQPGQTAGEASPTLANAVDAQARDAARQRNEQLNPGNQGQSQQPGSPSQKTASSSPATQSGSGEMPDGGFVDTMGIDRSGAQWGKLRERRTDDAAESRSANVSSQYAREIEAYFRAVARRAAEKDE